MSWTTIEVEVKNKILHFSQGNIDNHNAATTLTEAVRISVAG